MIYVIISAALVIFWLLVVDRPVLYIQFKDHELAKVKGHLPPALKHNLSEICASTDFSGSMKAYQRSERIKLVFSSSVPKSVQQRIRNVFPFNSFNDKTAKKRA
ncbi:hypothetical protein VA7868_02326 [Vibrio aerogenes CECT 7868]|uniref:DUF3634 domain-containing protein n=1 Tax=Vibrio aerogenes CECT 7868 TaxID=1216006 RepID=A0A1M5Z5Y1_9VIBR|nr:DUF3634 family protein [Vibrio aerogenes]SHI19629.1 hypothetical protein VA7868_02326 [Vibrio aerogenes CECT 7868]